MASFKREVIDRTPQSFKIECLTQVLNLFPSDIQPFYAGIGNKETDAISYQSVGVNKSKIFIINEKGEIRGYNKHYTTSYNQINDFVNEFFPQIGGYNTYDGDVNFFKAPLNKNYNIKDLFS
jgi:phosphatidate phosphatase LPIN